ncbi:MAG TPA: glycosyltransferase family 4 protein [Actinomycetota bacterium]|nr:glycosyltransferase family 4 protein [Actinomycetota bacterium]
MKVALVCPYAWDRPGGVQTHVGSLAHALAVRDHEVRVFAPALGRVSDTDVQIVGRAVPVPANGSIAPLAFGPLAARAIGIALDRFRPDVTHLHEPLIPSLSMLALMRGPGPALGTFHAAADGSLGYRAARPILIHVAARLRARTAVSDAARALIARYLPGDYALTPNGIDTSLYASAVPAELGPGKHVVFLGRLERRKGLEVLLQAMTRLRDIDCDLVVVGRGPEERAARALARRLLVPARFLGVVDDERKASILAAADVYCAPGLGGESFGIVLVEAMAAGAPVVCSSIPGFKAVVGGAAAVVTPGEPGHLADALRRILVDERLADRMRARSLQVSRAYDWGRLVANVESIYERVAEAV